MNPLIGPILENKALFAMKAEERRLLPTRAEWETKKKAKEATAMKTMKASATKAV